MAKKNPWAVALGKLAASKRSKEELAEAGRQGGLKKAANREAQNGTATAPDPAATPNKPVSKNKKLKKAQNA